MKSSLVNHYNLPRDCEITVNFFGLGNLRVFPPWTVEHKKIVKSVGCLLSRQRCLQTNQDMVSTIMSPQQVLWVYSPDDQRSHPLQWTQLMPTAFTISPTDCTDWSGWWPARGWWEGEVQNVRPLFCRSSSLLHIDMIGSVTCTYCISYLHTQHEIPSKHHVCLELQFL